MEKQPDNSSVFLESLIKWERHLLEAIGPFFKARAKRQYPQRSCPSEQRGKTANPFQPSGLH